MDLRITPQTSLANVLAQLDQQSRLLGRLQEHAATGKKVLSPSDDPIALGSILAARTQDRRLDAFLESIQQSRSSLNISVSALQDAGSILTEARNFAIEGSQSSYGTQEREALAEQVERLVDRLLEAANTQHAGRFLFAGAASQTKPFAIGEIDSAGRPVSVTYAGAEQRDGVPVSPHDTVATLFSGAEIFQRRERAVTIFSGTTGAAPGAGTDSAVGQGELLVQHTSTTFAAGSGVQAGLSSIAGDTILGPAGAHTLTIVDTSGTGVAGTIALDGGPAVALTDADIDLRVTGPSGDTIFVNMAAITPGYNGAIAVTADGTLSVDGGATTIAIDFSANQVVTDSVTGAVTNVNSTAIRRTGVERLDYQGADDAFQVLMTLRDDLRNVHGLAEADQLQRISRRLDELDRVRNGVLEVVGEQSASLKHLETLESHVRDVQLSTKQLLSDLEDVDLSQVIVQLQAQQNQLQLVLAVAGRLHDQSLLDFLR